MNWLQFTTALGIGAILTKLLDITWLNRVAQESERRKWLRDQRLAAYAEVAKDFLSFRLSGDRQPENPFEAYAVASRAILLAHDDALATRIDRFIADLDRFNELEKKDDSNSQTSARQLYDDLNDRAREIIRELRTELTTSENMERSAGHKAPWRALFIRAAGFGAGLSLIAVVLVGPVVWYFNRPAVVHPWNQEAVTAKFADLLARTGNPLVLTFRYTIENHTGRDYELPAAESLYKVLANGKGLEREATLEWDGGTSVPAGQIVNVGIHIEYEYTDGSVDLDAKLNLFTKRRLAEIEGFSALDQINRFEIRFPKPPEVK